MAKPSIPVRQSELVRLARGNRTCAEFGEEIGKHRSLVSRYESEKLGVPTDVLNHCLRFLANGGRGESTSPVQIALDHVRMAEKALEGAETPASKRHRKGGPR